MNRQYASVALVPTVLFLIVIMGFGSSIGRGSPIPVAQAAPLLQTSHTYTNPDYGFSLRYPTGWEVQEDAQTVQFSRDTVVLHISYRWLTEPPITHDMSNLKGTLVPMGTVTIGERVVGRHALVYEEQVKAIYYQHEQPEISLGKLVLFVYLTDIAADYAAIAIPDTIQQEADSMLASFAISLPAAVPQPLARVFGQATLSAPTPTTPDAHFAAFHADLAAMVTSWDNQNAVSVLDLQTGQLISINGARPQLAACTIKIGIMVAVAQDLEQGLYTPNDVAGLVQSMMGPSNTYPARELLRITGGGDIGAGVHRVNQIMWDLGATGSIITHPPGYPGEEYGYAASRGIRDNLLTTDDLVIMLGAIYRGEVLTPHGTAYVLQSMTIAPAWMNQSFSTPLPAGVRLYHKVGQLYGPHNTWNDAGIIEFDRGGKTYAYALAYLGSYGGSWQVSYNHAIAVSERVWGYFSQRYAE